MSVDFLDTNVVIYSLDVASTEKKLIAQQIVNNALSVQSALISYQVVQETLHTVQRKFATTVTDDDALILLERMLIPLMRVMPSAALYAQALRIHQRLKFSFYDALIIAAAQSAGCKRLLTEDMQHGQTIDGLRIVNPFI
ncbi:MAG: PIN domain-containing protein [Burkholderiaceae bacterium]